MSQPQTPFDRTSAVLAIAALGCIGLYLLIVIAAAGELEDQLRIEKKRRTHAEELAETRRQQLDGALEKIHEQRDDDVAGPA